MSDGTHLELAERERLAALRAEGLSLRGIARALGRAASTISRELRRNALPKGGYLPVHAEGCYRERRQRPAVLERDERLGRFVRERLLEGWTPERIAGWLKRGEERGLGRVSVETIYAFLHRPGQRGEKLWKLLPRGRARRGRRRARPPRGTIAERRSAASGVKRNIPGPCGKAMAANGNRGWGDVRRDASDVGGEGAAGRAQDRGAELTGDRATARPGGLDGQPRAAAQRPAEGRLPAGPRRGLLP